MYQGGIPPPLRTWIPTAPHHPASPAVSPQVRRAGPKATNANTAREQHRLDLHDASCSLLSPSRVAPPSSYRATRRSSLAARPPEGTAVLPPRALPTASITGQYTVAQFFSLRDCPTFYNWGPNLRRWLGTEFRPSDGGGVWLADLPPTLLTKAWRHEGVLLRRAGIGPLLSRLRGNRGNIAVAADGTQLRECTPECCGPSCYCSGPGKCERR